MLGSPRRCVRPAGSPRARSCGTLDRSVGTCCSRPAAGTGASSGRAACTAVTNASHATASTASTRSSRTTSAPRRIRPTCAAALLALDATLRTNRRELPVAELYRLPTEDDRRTTTLEPGELLLSVELPPVDRSVYLKAMERKRWAFPLVGVAAVARGGVTRSRSRAWRPIPWLLDGSVEDATPLPRNAYKVDIARALVERAAASSRTARRSAASLASRLSLVAALVLALAACGAGRSSRRRRPADANGCIPVSAPSAGPSSEAKPTNTALAVEDLRRHVRRRTAAASRSGSPPRRRRTTTASFAQPRPEGLLRRHDLPPDRPGLRDPGRRPDGDGQRRPRLHDGRPAARRRDVHPRGGRDGEDRQPSPPARPAASSSSSPRPTPGCRPTTRCSARSRAACRSSTGSASSATRRRRRGDADRDGRDREGDASTSVSAIVLAAGASTRYGGAEAARAAAVRARARWNDERRGDRRRRGSAPSSIVPGVRVVSCADWDSSARARRCAAGSPRSAPRSSAAVIVLADGPDLDPRAVERVLARGEADRRGELRRHPQPPGRARAKRVGDDPGRRRQGTRAGARRLLRPASRPATSTYGLVAARRQASSGVRSAASFAFSSGDIGSETATRT